MQRSPFHLHSRIHGRSCSIMIVLWCWPGDIRMIFTLVPPNLGTLLTLIPQHLACVWCPPSWSAVLGTWPGVHIFTRPFLHEIRLWYSSEAVRPSRQQQSAQACIMTMMMLHVGERRVAAWSKRESERHCGINAATDFMIICRDARASKRRGLTQEMFFI